MSARGLVILDRDGTLIDFHRDPELGVVTPAFHPSQLRLLPGVVEALATLRGAGWLLALASNQPGAAKGELPAAAIEATMAALEARLAAEGVPLSGREVCLHHPSGGELGDRALVGPCACRKPAPGMLLALASRLGVEPRAAWMVGDTEVDVRAARAAGMRAALVSPTERCELCPHKQTRWAGLTPDLHAATLLEVAHRIVALGHAPAPAAG